MLFSACGPETNEPAPGRTNNSNLDIPAFRELLEYIDRSDLGNVHNEFSDFSSFGTNDYYYWNTDGEEVNYQFSLHNDKIYRVDYGFSKPGIAKKAADAMMSMLDEIEAIEEKNNLALNDATYGLGMNYESVEDIQSLDELKEMLPNATSCWVELNYQTMTIRIRFSQDREEVSESLNVEIIKVLYTFAGTTWTGAKEESVDGGLRWRRTLTILFTNGTDGVWKEKYLLSNPSAQEVVYSDSVSAPFEYTSFMRYDNEYICAKIVGLYNNTISICTRPEQGILPVTLNDPYLEEVQFLLSGHLNER